MKYPADIVTDDGWGVIFEGHGLDVLALEVEMRKTFGYCDEFTIKTSEVNFTYHPRVKHCSRFDGWGCDEEGEWHKHWFACKPSPGTAFTIAHPVYPARSEARA